MSPALRAPGAQHRLADGALLDRRGAVRDADDDLGLGEGRAAVHLADEVLDHLLGDVEIGDHTLAHRADRLDGARRAAQHQLGLLADRPTPPCGRSSCGTRRPRARSARSPCPSRRPACSPCRGRSPCPTRTDCRRCPCPYPSPNRKRPACVGRGVVGSLLAVGGGWGKRGESHLGHILPDGPAAQRRPPERLAVLRRRRPPVREARSRRPGRTVTETSSNRHDADRRHRPISTRSGKRRPR